MEAKAYQLTADQLNTYIAGAEWPYWIVELPHRILYANPTNGLHDGEDLAAHCLAGCGFGPDGEFRWWRGEGLDDICATLISDGAITSNGLPEPVASADGQGLKVNTVTILVWGQEHDSEGAWTDIRRALPTDMNDLYAGLKDPGGHRAMKVRLYVDQDTGEVRHWRLVEPVILTPTPKWQAKGGAEHGEEA